MTKIILFFNTLHLSFFQQVLSQIRYFLPSLLPVKKTKKSLICHGETNEKKKKKRRRKKDHFFEHQMSLSSD